MVYKEVVVHGLVGAVEESVERNLSHTEHSMNIVLEYEYTLNDVKHTYLALGAHRYTALAEPLHAPRRGAREGRLRRVL